MEVIFSFHSYGMRYPAFVKKNKQKGNKRTRKLNMFLILSVSFIPDC